MAKGISERFRSIIRVTRICADIVGADVFDENYRMNVRTWFVLGIINVSFLFMSYTMYVGFIVGGDWKVILQVLSIGGGTLIQGYCKILNCIRQRHNYMFLLDEIISIYDEYEQKHSDYCVYLNKGIHLLTYLMKLCAFINISMALGMTLVTIVLTVFFNTRELIVQCLVPGVDPTTDGGFFLTNALQILFISVGCFGFYAGDMSFLTPMCQVMVLKGILKCKFHDLNAILDDESTSRQQSMDALKDIIKFHQRYLRFLGITQDTFYWVILVQMSTYSTGIICTIFCLLLGAWPGGYVYMFYCFVMMYVYCGIGTMVEVTNDSFIDSCYNDVRWYDLSISEQKMLQIMMMLTQSTGGLTVGSVVPLSMNTGMQVTKTIYSISMMLFNFAE